MKEKYQCIPKYALWEKKKKINNTDKTLGKKIREKSRHKLPKPGM